MKPIDVLMVKVAARLRQSGLGDQRQVKPEAFCDDEGAAYVAVTVAGAVRSVKEVAEALQSAGARLDDVRYDRVELGVASNEVFLQKPSIDVLEAVAKEALKAAGLDGKKVKTRRSTDDSFALEVRPAPGYVGEVTAVLGAAGLAVTYRQRYVYCLVAKLSSAGDKAGS
jgi:hypothetical protein